MLTVYYSYNEMFYEMFYVVELYREFQVSVVVVFLSNFNWEYSKKMFIIKMILGLYFKSRNY